MAFAGLNGASVNELALFSGAGGGILGGHLLGWRTVCAVEWEQYPASVLCARQNEGLLPSFPIWDDVQTFDGKPWRGIVDVVSGGFPCQDISAAGKGEGISGEKSSMWKHMARIIGEVRPRYAFVENSPMLSTRGMGTVLGDLVSLGFDAEWGVLSAADVGANHLRERIWILGKNTKQSRLFPHAEYDRDGWWEQFTQSLKETHGDVANADSRLRRRRGAIESSGEKRLGRLSHPEVEQAGYDLWSKTFGCSSFRGEKESRSRWWEVEPGLDRVADGMADRVDRLKAIGNGQVPIVAATAFTLLQQRFED